MRKASEKSRKGKKTTTVKDLKVKDAKAVKGGLSSVKVDLEYKPQPR
jgi:hypothetical protein